MGQKHRLALRPEALHAFWLQDDVGNASEVGAVMWAAHIGPGSTDLPEPWWGGLQERLAAASPLERDQFRVTVRAAVAAVAGLVEPYNAQQDSGFEFTHEMAQRAHAAAPPHPGAFREEFSLATRYIARIWLLLRQHDPSCMALDGALPPPVG